MVNILVYVHLFIINFNFQKNDKNRKNIFYEYERFYLKIYFQIGKYFNYIKLRVSRFSQCKNKLLLQHAFNFKNSSILQTK